MGREGKQADNLQSRHIRFSGATGTLNADEFENHAEIVTTYSRNGVQAIAIPAASTVPDGARVQVYKKGTAGAITFTPAAGTIGGAASYNTVDAQNDAALLIADAVTNDWLVVPLNIAA